MTARLTMEIFSYILTRDDNEFQAIREDILLRIMDIVTPPGPASRCRRKRSHLGRDSGMDQQKAEDAARKCRSGATTSTPFSRFRAHRHYRISNSLPYPKPGSALGTRK